MKALLALSIFSLLAACSTSVDNNDIADEGDDDYYGPAPEDITEIDETSYGINEVVNADGTYTFYLHAGPKEVATIEKEKPADGYSAYIFDEIDSYVYVAINPTGLGGYILYTGAYELYEVDTSTGDVRQLAEKTAGFATDLSDEGNIAYISGNEVGEHFILIQNVESNEAKTFQISDEFDQAGDATFSPDGNKVAYQATITSDEPNNEETAVFVIDLTTGEQTEFARQDGLFEIIWQDNDRPIVE